MSKSTQTIMVLFSLLLLFAGVGCVAASRWLTPAELDSRAVDYTIKAEVAEPNDYKGWANLIKAEKLERNVDSAHDVIQLDLEQLIQKDNLEYSIHKDVTAYNHQMAKEREEVLFGDEGLLSLGLSLAGFGSLTGFIGLMRKRPGDVTSQEMEQLVAQATGKTTGELSEKNKQFIEVVKGVQAFINTYRDKTPDVINDMKTMLNKAQGTSTQVAVAKVKKEVVV